MASQYINYIKSRARNSKALKAKEPVLTTEDEEFLHRVASPKEEGRDAQIVLMEGAQNIPLPQSPTEETFTRELVDNDGMSRSMSKSLKGKKEDENAGSPKGKRKGPWNWFTHGADRRKKENAAAGLSHIAKNLKTPGTEEVKEEEDLTMMLEKLNLAAVNNRVFSISDEIQDLLKRFNLILKDLVNGVPTAYNDLESLLTNGDGQLQKTFNHLPGFLQKLIEQLPDKVTEKFGPEFLAMAAERAGKGGISMDEAAKKAKKVGLKVPSLKELVGKPAAIAGLLRSIVSFLQARFPALMGMNVLMSLALFILLFVLWYCYKRGREVRLENDKLNAEGQDATITYKPDENDNNNNTSETQTTNLAPNNRTSIQIEPAKKEGDGEEVEAGVRDARDDAGVAGLPSAPTPVSAPVPTMTTTTTCEH
ncbi:hypothetical protein ACO22_00541 [Paracoccidioides brasiliensis]|uniref:Uncharacterized protein n=1 Tax=Paracoccidioides brasiliensis TaxID=121759 RepID=A0A1D2JP60_PARBR|nr:hypothetical protein ACO22_00541 [Paracoccidioides brasiliensis]